MKKLSSTPVLLLIALSIGLMSFSFQRKVKSLEGYDIKKLSLRYDSLLLLPGSEHKIGLVIFTADNEVFKTSGFSKGTVRWKNFDINIQNARFKNGTITIDKTDDQRNTFVALNISPKHQPEKIFHDTLWLNYEKEIRVFPLNSFKKIPGTKLKFGLEVTYDNYKQEVFTSNRALKKVLPDYEIITKGGRQENGEFIVSNDIFDNPDHTPGFLIQLKNDTNVYDILDFQFDYKENYKYSAAGNSGMFGSSGFSGASGSTGEHGRPGRDGEHGADGYNGDDIDVFVDVYYDSIVKSDLIKVFVENVSTRKQLHYLIHPQGGSLFINATGGRGGSGGDGGRGGNGGNGTTGEFYTEYIKETIIKKDTAGREIKEEITKQITKQKTGGDGGHGGPGGYGGVGGNGGEGGYIIVYYTPAANRYLDLIKIDTSGGYGGDGGDGGNGGSGGSGGSGRPSGRNGSQGMNGMDGPSGYDGLNGRVEYKLTDNIPW